jgi:hypothetical protein
MSSGIPEVLQVYAVKLAQSLLISRFKHFQSLPSVFDILLELRQDIPVLEIRIPLCHSRWIFIIVCLMIFIKPEAISLMQSPYLRFNEFLIDYSFVSKQDLC